MSGLAAFVIASTLTIGAPIPPEPAPDPLARGYMGVEVQTGGGLIIERVEPGQPAFKAGLQHNDVIVRVGTLEPQAFEQVISHVCSLRPGAIVEIEVQRGSERKVFKLKLARRPAYLDFGEALPDVNDVIPK